MQFPTTRPQEQIYSIPPSFYLSYNNSTCTCAITDMLAHTHTHTRTHTHGYIDMYSVPTYVFTYMHVYYNKLSQNVNGTSECQLNAHTRTHEREHIAH